jgi:hypothetical protein
MKCPQYQQQNPSQAKCCNGCGSRLRRHFTAAATMYREMGMTYWLEQEQREFER